MSRGKSGRSIKLIAAAQCILEEIQPASVRAVCYRLFVEGLIPYMGARRHRAGLPGCPNEGPRPTGDPPATLKTGPLMTWVMTLAGNTKGLVRRKPLFFKWWAV